MSLDPEKVMEVAGHLNKLVEKYSGDGGHAGELFVAVLTTAALGSKAFGMPLAEFLRQCSMAYDSASEIEKQQIKDAARTVWKPS